MSRQIIFLSGNYLFGRKSRKKVKGLPELKKENLFLSRYIRNFKNITGYIREAKSRNITEKLRMLRQKQAKTLKEGLP